MIGLALAILIPAVVAKATVEEEQWVLRVQDVFTLIVHGR